MKRILLILIIPFCACSSFIDEQVYYVDPALQPYYDMFLTEALNRGYDYYGTDVIIKFDDFENILGKSQRRNDGVARILISKKHFYSAAKNKFHMMNEVTMMHELGHAYLYREHEDNCASIMVSGGCKYKIYKKNRTEMLNELFGSEPIE